MRTILCARQKLAAQCLHLWNSTNHAQIFIFYKLRNKHSAPNGESDSLISNKKQKKSPNCSSKCKKEPNIFQKHKNSCYAQTSAIKIYKILKNGILDADKKNQIFIFIIGYQGMPPTITVRLCEDLKCQMMKQT